MNLEGGLREEVPKEGQLIRRGVLEEFRERAKIRGGSRQVLREEIVSIRFSLTLLEAHELKRILKDEYGIEAVAGAMVTRDDPVIGGKPGAIEGEREEFDVILKVEAGSKINVIKEVRAITGLGLKEARDLVESGRALKSAVSQEEAEEIKAKFEEIGASVQLKKT